MRHIKSFQSYKIIESVETSVIDIKDLEAYLNHYNDIYTRLYNAKTNRDDRNELDYSDYLNPHTPSSGPSESEVKKLETEMSEAKKKIEDFILQWHKNNIGEMKSEMKTKLEKSGFKTSKIHVLNSMKDQK
jgi:hypothetical protein